MQGIFDREKAFAVCRRNFSFELQIRDLVCTPFKLNIFMAICIGVAVLTSGNLVDISCPFKSVILKLIRLKKPFITWAHNDPDLYMSPCGVTGPQWINRMFLNAVEYLQYIPPNFYQSEVRCGSDMSVLS